jgi:tetratricopeptide (TPR) repeat protein
MVNEIGPRLKLIEYCDSAVKSATIGRCYSIYQGRTIVTTWSHPDAAGRLMGLARETASPVAESGERLLGMGLERHRAADPAGAETLFRRALAETPDDPTALYLLGLLRFELGDPEEAEALIARVTVLKPRTAKAWLTLGNLRQVRGDNAGAAAAYDAAARLAPADAEALVGLSQVRLAGGDAAGALSAAESAAAIAPADGGAQLARGAALAALRRPVDAVVAYRAAVGRAPSSAPAHLGLAVELLQTEDPGAALPHAERSVALDGTTALAWMTLGSALRRVGRRAEAAEALERSVALAPERRTTILSLGLLYVEMDRQQPALRCLRRALELDPDDKDTHAALSAVYCSLGDLALSRRHAEAALAFDPAMIAAHQTLARIEAREGRPDKARLHRDAAYGVRNFYLAEASRPLRRVLILATTDLGNTPDRHLIPSDRYTRLTWFVAYAGASQMKALPDFDVVFNGIGDADEAGPTAANVARFLEACPRPVLNRPEAVARTFRHLAPALFDGIDALVVPKTVRLAAETVAARGVREAARLAGVAAPLIARPIGSHGGHGVRLVTARQEAGAEIEPDRDHYATAFHDFRSGDGLYRKYRMIFVDRRPYPYHLAIGPSWMVHYETSGAAQHPERLAEERRFLEDPEAVLGEAAMAAVRAVGERLDLDFAGIDFARLDDGRVLLFEANATMLAHPEEPDGPLAHKNPYVERILAAFRQVLAGGGPVDESR